jgi:hypothetical protein
MHARLARQEDAGFTGVEFGGGQAAPAHGRIDDLYLLRRPTFHDDKVVEIPMDDRGQGGIRKIGRRARKRLHPQPEATGRLDDRPRRDAIPADPTRRPAFGNAGLPAIVAEQHGQTGGAAFDRAQLQQDRNAPPVPPLARDRARGPAARPGPGPPEP